MSKFISFPSIEQFRSIVKHINDSSSFIGVDDEGNAQFDYNLPKPIIKFRGTVKLHGTNAGVCFDGVDMWAQSRSNIITPEKDNAGFAFFMESKKETFDIFFKRIISNFKIDITQNIVSIYGEWCGGNIQKGVAINGLDKMFVIFGVKISPNDESKVAYWVDESFSIDVAHGNVIALSQGNHDIWNVDDFMAYNIEIDFNHPELSQNKLIELTEAVEAECPVGKEFGNLGIGEGIVWKAMYKNTQQIFKVKGEKHSVSKVKKLANVDVEKVNSINAFVEYSVTENRLKQGIDVVFTQQNRDINNTLIGEFLKWVANDIFKEEMDTLVANNLEPKEVGSAISKAARIWFGQQI